MVIAKKVERILTVLLIAGILGFLVLIGVTNICHFNFSINADIASDAVLGKLIWDSKEIIPSTWYIAEETRIICMANVAALFYGLTHNMTLSAGLACCTMTILILWSAFYFGGVLHLERKEKLLLGFLCLMLPADHTVLELSYLFASYYAVHIVILFLTFGIYLEVHGGKAIKWPKLAIGIFFSLIFGMQGARGILVIYGPLFGMAVIWNLYRIYCRKKPKKAEIIISLWTVVLLVVSFTGMLFPFSTGQELSRNIRNGFHKLCFDVVPDMFDAMGFGSSQPAAGKVCAALLILIMVYLLLDILYRMCRKKEIDTVEWGFLILCSSPVVTAFMVAFTTVESTERYYFLFSYVMAYAAVLFFRKVKASTAMQQGMRICLGIVLAALTMVRYCNIYLPVLRAEEPPQGEVYEVVRYLEENDFEMAYSTFANANTMTVLSNGKVRVASVDSVAKMNICKWMSSTDWYVPNVPYDERTAYIIPESDMEVFDAFLLVHEEDVKLEMQIGRYS
ncbi:MAG: hypothetical protein K2H40_13090, partial [Lachnospiraceae bacterium]|nr:hypothetical protein [Lachnospiraceae bacterium]